MMSLDGNGDLRTAGTVNPSSDRNVKANFASVDSGDILERLAELPIQRWNYTNDLTTPPLASAPTTNRLRPLTPMAWRWRPSKG
jgi:hypothetical protein